ncbi:MAG TPA: isoprenylcysteine carboxylmethyltransferase family protein [Acidimicrobiales bacterium]|nr:isoprenylcysteine carboxylmethyltransferase family protein [Acidimicrobiales bacterium]
MSFVAARQSRFLEPQRLPPRRQRAVRIGANLIGAAGAAFFAQSTLRSDLHAHSGIGTVFLVEQSLVVLAYLIRRPARAVTARLGDWLLAFGGTFGGVLFSTGGAHPKWGVSIGLWLQLVGLAAAIASFLALGRNFGFSAADRGLATRGPYAVVRHPIYASYLLVQFGFLLQSVSVRNVLVILLTTSCNVGRALVEEDLLVSGEMYRSYRGRVRWRLVPGVW